MPGFDFGVTYMATDMTCHTCFSTISNILIRYLSCPTLKETNNCRQLNVKDCFSIKVSYYSLSWKGKDKPAISFLQNFNVFMLFVSCHEKQIS